MTYLHIRDQGLPKHALGERRSDGATAEKVHDGLRADGPHAAAQAMAHQQVDFAVALRVLAEPGRRRAPADADAPARRPIDAQHGERPHRAAVPA